jgi:hypothetical protein
LRATAAAAFSAGFAESAAALFVVFAEAFFAVVFFVAIKVLRTED